MDESDRLSLRFGIGYDESDDRIVAVYLTDLGSLPPKQQRLWREFVVDGECRMSEDYFRTSILAEWPEHISVYQAFIYEQVEINRLANLIGRPPLFRKTYEEHKRPRGFSFFVRPTRKEYLSFVELLDKMLSQNVNYDYFDSDVDRFATRQLKDGTVERAVKGSLAMLQEWLSTYFEGIDAEEVGTIVRPVRQVRDERNEPSHKIIENEFDPSYYDKQEELVTNAYRGLTELRLRLMSVPSASTYEPPEILANPKIKNY